MTIRTEQMRYAADGLAMESDFYWDEAIAGARPAVLVFPEAFGLGTHARGRAERLAGLGYAALACDVHGGAGLLSLEALMPHIEALRAAPERTRARARGGLDALLARPEVDRTRIAAIGFCFGGSMAFELARSGAEIAAAVGFHSGLATTRPAARGAIRATLLACIGADDPGIPAEQRVAFEDEMRTAGADWRLHVYGGVLHSFTNPDAAAIGQPDFARYDAAADARSWHEMLALFAEVFGGSGARA